jgi:hypothetical protein
VTAIVCNMYMIVFLSQLPLFVYFELWVQREFHAGAFQKFRYCTLLMAIIRQSKKKVGCSRCVFLSYGVSCPLRQKRLQVEVLVLWISDNFAQGQLHL